MTTSQAAVIHGITKTYLATCEVNTAMLLDTVTHIAASYFSHNLVQPFIGFLRN